MQRPGWLISGVVCGLIVIGLGIAAWKIKSIDIPLISESGSSSSSASSRTGTSGSPAVRRCIALWNAGRIPEFGGRQQLANRVLLTTEGQALVTNDRQGTCLVAFPESAGSEPGGGGGAALTFSFERGAWGLYLLIGHKSAPVNPAVAEEQRGSVNEREALMQRLEGQVETEPNATLGSTGLLTSLGGESPGSVDGISSESGNRNLTAQLKQAAENSPEMGVGAPGVKTELRDVRSDENWAAASWAEQFPDQSVYSATAVFQNIDGKWKMEDIRSLGAGCESGIPTPVLERLELDCGGPSVEAAQAGADQKEATPPHEPEQVEAAACVKAWNKRPSAVLGSFEAAARKAGDLSARVTSYSGPAISVPISGGSVKVMPGECIFDFLGSQTYEASLDGKWYPAEGNEQGLYSYGLNNLAATGAVLVGGGKLRLTGESLRTPGE